MKLTGIATIALLMLAAPAMAGGSHAGGHDEMMAAGKPGDASHVDRTVAITMSETDDGRMLFEPAGLEVRKGETIRFTVTNAGQIDHEFVLDSHEKNMEHKALMERFPEMEHDDPNAIRLSEGGSGEIIWTFAVAGTFEFACLIPGHYESGMKGDIVVASK